jgi:hypothetical protein
MQSQGKPSSLMDSDTALKSRRGAQDQGRNALCAAPRIPVGSSRSGSPGGKQASKKFLATFVMSALLSHAVLTAPHRITTA